MQLPEGFDTITKVAYYTINYNSGMRELVEQTGLEAAYAVGLNSGLLLGLYYPEWAKKALAEMPEALQNPESQQEIVDTFPL